MPIVLHLCVKLSVIALAHQVAEHQHELDGQREVVGFFRKVLPEMRGEFVIVEAL